MKEIAAVGASGATSGPSVISPAPTKALPLTLDATNAAMFEAFYATLAAEMGVSKADAERRYPLEVRTAEQPPSPVSSASPTPRPALQALQASTFRIGDLPRDMREELFNQHATSDNPEATEAEFYAMRVPCGLIGIDSIAVADYPPAQLLSYQVTDPAQLPPIVISDGRLVDGGHRISSERLAQSGSDEAGLARLRFIDLTGLIDTERTGYISDLPGRDQSLHQQFQQFRQPAFHGTPYAGITRFDAGKIGTGEGNQTYGWGLYFAGRKEVGEHYRKSLAPAVFNGPAGNMSAQVVVAAMAAELGLDASDQNEIFGSLLDITRGDRSFTDFAGAAETYGVLGRDRIADAFRWAHDSGYSALPAGQLYEVDLPGDEAMLIWDVRIDEQPAQILTALAELFTEEQLAYAGLLSRLVALRLATGTKGQAYSDLYDEFEAQDETTGSSFHDRFGTWGPPTGGAIYASIARVMGGQKPASDFLAERGIKGIKYADGLSRGQDEAASHNYVVFSGDHVAVRSTFYQGPQDPTPEASQLAQAHRVPGAWTTAGAAGATGATGATNRAAATAALSTWAQSSAAIDAITGEPLVLYHGTNADFATFDSSRLGSSSEHSTAKAGHFFTADPKIAATFSGVRWDGWPLTESFSTGANVMPVHLAVSAPARITADQFLKRFVRGPEDFAAFAKEADGLGHDGILISGDARLAEAMGGEEYGADSWVVFHPEQVKSAIGNQGSFDGASSNILMQSGVAGVSTSPGATSSQVSQIASQPTPSFKQWFSKSMVVDEDQQPLKVYHGTAGDFTEFRATRAGEYGPAIYFTDSAREAGEYGDGQRGPLGTSIMPVFLSIQNPYTDGVEAFWKEFGAGDEDAKAVERAAAAGYDGVISSRPDRYYDNSLRAFVDRGGVLTHYIAFRPDQVKSAIGNQGSFDSSTSNILHQAEVPAHSALALDYARRWDDHSSNGESADDFDWERRSLTRDEMLSAVGGIEALQREIDKQPLERYIDPALSDLSLPVVFAYEPWTGQGGTLWDGVHRTLSALMLGTTIEAVVGTPTAAYLEREDASFELAGLPTISSRTASRTASRTTAPRREAFLAWFGASKMVQDDGLPAELYHGTDQDFDAFDPTRSSRGAAFGPGIYLTEDRENTNWKRGLGSNVMPLFASIKNPLDIRTPLTADGASRLQAIGLKRATEGDPAPLITMERLFGSVGAAAQAAGFDGLLHFGPAGKRHVLAFKANQVKSSIGNRGTFSTDSDHVLHQSGVRRSAQSSGSARSAVDAFPAGWTGWSRPEAKAPVSAQAPAPAPDPAPAPTLKMVKPVPQPASSSLAASPVVATPVDLMAPLTKSRAFKKWFLASKAADSAGVPLTLFHGTAVDGTTYDAPAGQLPKGAFTEFKKSMLGQVSGSSDAKEGFWFSASEDRARDAASDAMASEWGSSAYIYEVHLSIQNPLVVPSIKALEPSEVAKLARKARRHGHDGLIFTIGEAGPADYLVFDPRQIKSAHANQGSFDPTDRSILKQEPSQEPPAAPRGQISFGNDITLQPSVITSLADADSSTIPHEAGHFFLEVYGHLASQADAPPSVKADMDKLLDWFGIKGEELLPRADDALPPSRKAPQAAAVRMSEPAPIRAGKAKAFAEWFGRSMVLDDAGAPRVVYHGTKKDFDTFDKNHAAEGFHFGSAPQATVRVAGPGKFLMPVHLAIENPRRSKDTGGGWAARIRSATSAGHDGIVYLNRHEGIQYEAFERAAQALADRRGGAANISRLDQLTDTEFKALVPEAADSYIAFKPQQIKSAIGNRGSFDATSANILHQTAPAAVGSNEDRFNQALIDQQLHDEDPVAFFEAKLSAAETHLFNLTGYEATASYNGTPTRFWSPDGTEYGFEDLPDEVRAAAQQFFDIDEAWAAGEAGYAPEFFGGEADEARTIFDQSAFHGTPHRNIEAFDVAKIGSGEGNQTFGWGLYFASIQAVAEHYKNSDRARWSLDGKQVSGERWRRDQAWPGAREAFGETLTILTNHTSLADARKQIEEGVAENRASSKAGMAARDRLRVFEGILPRLRPTEGQVYHVGIPDDDHMLLWDEPFARQPLEVREAIEEAALAFRRGDATTPQDEAIDAMLTEVDEYPALTGANLYEGLAHMLGKSTKTSYNIEPSPQDASEALAAIGIKGIKYLDGSSRALHAGSSNYVIFRGADVAVTRTLYQTGRHGRIDQPLPGRIALPTAPRRVAMATKGSTYGRTALEVWRAMPMAQKRPFHEQFARGFEAYLMEGKAPVPQLQGLFGRFKAWLTAVYKNLAALDVRLTNDVRGVMGRMLAKDAGSTAAPIEGDRDAVHLMAQRLRAAGAEGRSSDDLAEEQADAVSQHRSERQR